MNRLRSYFDTQIYSDSRFKDEKWRKHLRASKYRCDLSSITLMELLDGIAKSRTEEDFKRAQRPLKIAWAIGGKYVLPFPGRFAIERVFRVGGRKWKFETRDFRKWHSVAIRAPDRQTLFRGQMRWPGGVSQTKKVRLDPKVITSQLEEGRNHYVQQIRDYISETKPDWLGRRGEGVKNLLTKEEQRTLGISLEGEPVKNGFFDGLLQTLGLNREDVLRSQTVGDVVSKFDAVFTHRKHIFRQVLTTPYKFEEDESAFHDLQQLYYLADPNYLFVTEDSGLREAVSKSTQADRVISLGEFIRLISN